VPPSNATTLMELLLAGCGAEAAGGVMGVLPCALAGTGDSNLTLTLQAPPQVRRGADRQQPRGPALSQRLQPTPLHLIPPFPAPR
jgi:hypothetical protein